MHCDKAFMNTEPVKSDDLKTCKKCGQTVIFDNDGFCLECGTRPAPLPGDLAICKQCGQTVKFDNEGFCPKCGTRPTSLRGDFETCKACGQTVKVFDKDGCCPKCGKPRPPAKLIKTEANNSQSNAGAGSGLTWFDRASFKIMNVIALAVLIYCLKSCH
jgi:predicted amidophosphoribosyltransferase